MQMSYVVNPSNIRYERVMLASETSFKSRFSKETPNRLRVLLYWEILLLAGVCGLFAYAFPGAAVASLIVLGLLAWSRICGARVVGFCVVFACAWAVGWWTAPDMDVQPPLWLDTGKAYDVQGVVDSVEGDTAGRLKMVLREVVVQGVGQGGAPAGLPGKMKLTWDQATFRPEVGAELAARLRIRVIDGFANPGGMDIRAYWARRGVYFSGYAKDERGGIHVLRQAPGNLLRGMRNTLFHRVLGELSAGDGLSQGRAMLLALLFGERSFILKETKDLMARASLSHSMALSGLHVGYVVLLGWGAVWLLGLLRPGVFLRIPFPKLAALSGAACAGLYVWLGGASPSLLRAFLMFLIWGALLWMGRERVLLEGLLLAVGVLLLFSPQMVFDLRLQFSAVAVGGIAAYLELRKVFVSWRRERAAQRTPDPVAELIPQPVWRERVRRYVVKFLRYSADFLLLSLAAQLATLPLAIHYFGVVSPHLYYNLFWLPVLGFVVMPLGLLGLMVVTVSPALGGWFLCAGGDICDGLLKALSWLFEHGALEIWRPFSPGWQGMLGYWSVAGAALCFALGDAGRLPRSWRGAFAMGLTLAMWPVGVSALEALDRGVSLTMLDVGQGQALVVEAPGGERMLLDGGGFSSPRFDVGEAVTAKALNVRRAARLEIVVSSHPHTDHLQGLLYPLREFSVGRFLRNGDSPVEMWREKLERILATRKPVVNTVVAGDVISLGEGVVLEALHPERDFQSKSENDRSLVFRLVWNGRGLALLPGDIERSGVAQLMKSGVDLQSDVLVLPHHGGRSSLSKRFYRKAAPKVVLASVGRYNPWGMPNKHVVQALAEQGVAVQTTAEQGAITVSWASPGASPVVETFRTGRGEQSGK